MSRAPIRIRAFLVGTMLLLLVVPTLAGGTAWLVERSRQQSALDRRLSTAVDYLTAHRTAVTATPIVQGFARLLGRLDLLGQLVVVTDSPPAKNLLYVSPALQTEPVLRKQAAARAARAGRVPATVPAGPPASGTRDYRRAIPVGTAEAAATLTIDLYYRPASRAGGALVGLVTAVLVLLGGLGAAFWLAGRWMVAPLTTLSEQVDKVAGGDLAIAVPRSRVGEIANIAQAVDGMTTALGETEERRRDAEEARRFLVTSIAHDLRTPLFALRGHLQAIGAHLGNPSVHLERAEARASALERLIGDLFAYTRDDYARPALQLETLRVDELLGEVTAVAPAGRAGEATFELAGDPKLAVVVDRDRAKRALANIIDNAVRFSPAGTPIRLSWHAADAATVELEVCDEGAGIDPDLLPHVFEPGIRGAPAAGGVDGGAGLGLAIAKRLLEQQDATVTAESPAGGGTTLRITLPRSR